MIRIEKVNELTIKILSEKDVAMEIYEKFSFQVPGYQFTPKYKRGMWDGFIRLFKLNTRTMPQGLLIYLLKFINNQGWTVTIDKELKPVSFEKEMEQFIDKVFPELVLEPYDYQVEALVRSIKYNQALVLSPTGCLDENTEIDVILTNEAMEFLKDLRNSNN